MATKKKAAKAKSKPPAAKLFIVYDPATGDPYPLAPCKKRKDAVKYISSIMSRGGNAKVGTYGALERARQ